MAALPDFAFVCGACSDRIEFYQNTHFTDGEDDHYEFSALEYEFDYLCELAAELNVAANDELYVKTLEKFAAIGLTK